MPRVLRWLSLAVLLLSVGMIFLGGQLIGVTSDEPLHVQRINHYLATGWYLGDGQLLGDQPAPGMTQQFVYAPVTMLLLHVLCATFGVEPWGLATDTAGAYAMRHFGIGLVSLVGLMAVALTGRLLMRRWDWALVAAATFGSLPIWTGHSMFNIKDVPVATGYAVFTLGCCVLARTVQDAHWRLRLAGPLCIASGTFLAIGTRPGIWPAFAASLGTLLVCCAARSGGSLAFRLRLDLWRFRDLTGGIVAGFLGLWAVDPNVFSEPFHALWMGAFSSANFLHMTSSPWFVPLRVLLEMPLLVVAFFAFGTWVGAKRLWQARFRPSVSDTRFTLLLVQVFTLPTIAIIDRTSLYGDMRQLLFATPGACIVATYGMAELVRRARSRGVRDVLAVPITATAVAGALLVPLVDQASYFPYNYAYYNPLTKVAGVATGGDYYRASGRAIARYIPDGRVVCAAEPNKNGAALRLAHLDGWVDCATAQTSPISPYIDEERPRATLARDEFWMVSFVNDSGEPNNCEKVKGYSRRTILGTLSLAQLFKCRRAFPVLDQRPIAFEYRKSAYWLDFPNLGWFVPSSPAGLTSRGGESTLTFRLADEFSGGPVRLHFSFLHPSHFLATYGGEPVNVKAHNGAVPGATLMIPRALVDRAAREPLTLAFRSSTGRPLAMTLLRMQAEAVT